MTDQDPPHPARRVPPDEAEDDDALLLHDSALVRGFLLGVGVLCVVLGAIGLLLPIIPTVPFLIAAAACFARASPTLYRRLVRSRFCGPPILEWRRHRSIPWRTKLWAIALLGVSLGTSTLLFIRPAWLQVVVATLGIAISVWLYRVPSRDRPTR